MEENVMMNEVTEDVMTVVEVPEVQEGNGLGVVICLGVAAVAGVGAWLYKNREKFTTYRIKRWEKKGYVVVKAEDLKKDVEEVEPIE
jgi:hypothetical protein